MHIEAFMSHVVSNIPEMSEGSAMLVGYEQPQSPYSCSGCGCFIYDRSYLLMAGKAWHSICLKCSICSQTLHSANSCFIKDGNILCKEDYYRKVPSRACAGCGCLIGAEDLVMRARDLVYHVGCFTCITCRRVLVQGERFSVDEETGRLHCCNCWKQNEYFESEIPDSSSVCSGYYEMETSTKSRRKRKNQIQTDPGIGMSTYPLEYSEHDHTGGFPPQKTKRMRTSFKHHQLRAMKNYFNVNHNPDAKDLKQLALETGLTKRVLQVWFQNARAKYRRGKGGMKEGEKKNEKGRPNGNDEKDKTNSGSDDENKDVCDQQNDDVTSDGDVTISNEKGEGWQSSSAAEFGTPAMESSSIDTNNFSPGDSCSLSPRSDSVDESSMWTYENASQDSYNAAQSMSGNVSGNEGGTYSYTELESISRDDDVTQPRHNAYDDVSYVNGVTYIQHDNLPNPYHPAYNNEKYGGLYLSNPHQTPYLVPCASQGPSMKYLAQDDPRMFSHNYLFNPTSSSITSQNIIMNESAEK